MGIHKYIITSVYWFDMWLVSMNTVPQMLGSMPKAAFGRPLKGSCVVLPGYSGWAHQQLHGAETWRIWSGFLSNWHPALHALYPPLGLVCLQGAPKRTAERGAHPNSKPSWLPGISKHLAHLGRHLAAPSHSWDGPPGQQAAKLLALRALGSLGSLGTNKLRQWHFEESPWRPLWVLKNGLQEMTTAGNPKLSI